MMDDRTLLERAAKAAGIEHPGGNHSIDLAIWDSVRREWWRPLTDDGDALRLAVKLKMDVYSHELGALVNNIDGRGFDEQGADPYAATRRAIVRAAASMAGE